MRLEVAHSPVVIGKPLNGGNKIDYIMVVRECIIFCVIKQ